MVRLIRLALAALLAASELPAQSPAPPPGPRTGSPFPAFRLPDQNGKMRDRKSLEGPHGLLLVFFQSADWCPYCKNQLAEMQANLDAARQAGIGLAAVSYDSPAVLRQFAARRSITFPLLSDHASALIRAASLEMPGPPKGSPFAGAAYPAAVLINERGIVQAKYIHGDLRERDSAAAVLMQRFGIGGGPPSTVTGKRIEARLTSSDTQVSPGERILLEVSFDLRPGLHVYAPGVHDYIPIDWSLRPPVGWTAAPVVFPPSETLRLEAIQETVPAYRGHVVLRRDVTVSPDASPGPVILSGALRYQACDDTMCYIPETLPLEWKLTVLSLDKTRAAGQNK
jgi:peroxiredoxin